jgi:hypothetical protein
MPSLHSVFFFEFFSCISNVLTLAKKYNLYAKVTLDAEDTLKNIH